MEEIPSYLSVDRDVEIGIPWLGEPSALCPDAGGGVLKFVMPYPKNHALGEDAHGDF